MKIPFNNYWRKDYHWTKNQLILANSAIDYGNRC